MPCWVSVYSSAACLECSMGRSLLIIWLRGVVRTFWKEALSSNYTSGTNNFWNTTGKNKRFFLFKKKDYGYIRFSWFLNEVPCAVESAGHVLWNNMGLSFGCCLLIPPVQFLFPCGLYWISVLQRTTPKFTLTCAARKWILKSHYWNR